MDHKKMLKFETILMDIELITHLTLLQMDKLKAPDEYTLYTIHSYNDRECVCIDIEDQSERRFPWEHIYLLNHQRSYVEGSEVLALSKEGTEWLTAYYPARVRYASCNYSHLENHQSVISLWCLP